MARCLSSPLKGSIGVASPVGTGPARVRAPVVAPRVPDHTLLSIGLNRGKARRVLSNAAAGTSVASVAEVATREENGLFAYADGVTKVRKWWEEHKVDNVATANTVDDLERIMTEARLNGRCVVVEFFAGHCWACRSLYPKLCKIAENEFPHVQFVKVHVDDSEEGRRMQETHEIDKFPYFHLYHHDTGLVDRLAASLNRQSLMRLRCAIKFIAGAKRAINDATEHFVWLP